MMRNRKNCRNANFAVFNMTALSIVPPNPSYTRIYQRDWASHRGFDFRGAIQRAAPTRRQTGLFDRSLQLSFYHYSLDSLLQDHLSNDVGISFIKATIPLLFACDISRKHI